jgi:hypothetical protein
MRSAQAIKREYDSPAYCHDLSGQQQSGFAAEEGRCGGDDELDC